MYAWANTCVCMYSHLLYNINTVHTGDTMHTWIICHAVIYLIFYTSQGLYSTLHNSLPYKHYFILTSLNHLPAKLPTFNSVALCQWIELQLMTWLSHPSHGRVHCYHTYEWLQLVMLVSTNIYAIILNDMVIMWGVCHMLSRFIIQ